MTPGQWSYLFDRYADRFGLPQVERAERPRSLRTGEVLKGAPRSGRTLSDEDRTRRINHHAYDFLPREYRYGHVPSFTAVMSAICLQTLKYGRCDLLVWQLGANCGYQRTSVRNAVGEARRPRDGEPPLIDVEHNRRPGRRKNEANTIRIVCPHLLAHLKAKARHMRGISKRGRLFWGLPLPPMTSKNPQATGISDKNKNGVAHSGDHIDGSGAPSAPDRLGGGWIARPAPS